MTCDTYILVQGACLRYDAEKQILIGTPFINGFNCWNAADCLVIIAPFGLLVFFMCSLSMGCKTFQTICERVEPVTFTLNYGKNSFEDLYHKISRDVTSKLLY